MSPSLSGGDERSEPESAIPALSNGGETSGTGPGPEPARGAAAAGSAIPCLNKTTACKDEPPLLPGPRKKQARALVENIEWMAKTFGQGRVGFLTLTIGDMDAGGRFRNLRDRKEAQRRFHSLLTNELCKHFQCGVVVTERHANGGIHFHLAVVCREDIRGNIDFDACFPPKDRFGKPTRKPDYSTANEALKREWAYFRHICRRYGFGRHQLQPMRENGEALGRYLGAYLQKDWMHRWPEDKGARCVRYFGHWSKEPRRQGDRRRGPPFNSRFGWMTPRSRAWREMVKQTVMVLRYNGAQFTEETIKDVLGPRWAWKMGKLFKHVRFEPGEWLDAATRLAILEHNAAVKAFWLNNGGDPNRDCWCHVTEITLNHLRPSPEWKMRLAELELVKDVESEIRKGLRRLAKRDRAKAEQLRLVVEVADELCQAQKDLHNQNGGIMVTAYAKHYTQRHSDGIARAIEKRGRRELSQRHPGSHEPDRTDISN